MELDTLMAGASAEMQWDLFEVLAERLALTTDMRPGEVMAIDAGYLSSPHKLLHQTLNHCRASRN